MSCSEEGLRPCGPLGLEDQKQTPAHNPGEASLRFLCPWEVPWGRGWIILVTPATSS